MYMHDAMGTSVCSFFPTLMRSVDFDRAYTQTDSPGAAPDEASGYVATTEVRGPTHTGEN